LSDLRIEQSECSRQPRGMHFQRCQHLAKLPARKVERQLQDQPLGVFDGRKKCIHTHWILVTLGPQSPPPGPQRVRVALRLCSERLRPCVAWRSEYTATARRRG